MFLKVYVKCKHKTYRSIFFYSCTFKIFLKIGKINNLTEIICVWDWQRLLITPLLSSSVLISIGAMGSDLWESLHNLKCPGCTASDD